MPAQPEPPQLLTTGTVCRGDVLQEECDDRFLLDTKGGVFLVANGSGPTYGGYHLPIAMEEAASEIVRATANSAEPDAASRLRVGMRAAAELLDQHRRAYEKTLETVLARKGSDRLEVVREASIQHARDRFGRHIRSFVHYGLSVTAIHVHRGELAIAQVGSCHAYRVRAGVVELLLPDHLLGTVSNDPSLAESHPDLCTRLLGMGGEVDVRSTDVQGDDVLILLGDGAWKALSAAAIAVAAEAHGAGADEVAATLRDRIPSSARRSAAIVVVVVPGDSEPIRGSAR